MIGISPSAIGLHLENDRIHLVELKQQFRKLHRVQAVEFPFPNPSGDLYANPAAVTQALKETLQKSGKSFAPIAASLPEKEVIVRYFEMPLFPKREWPGAVSFEAQKYVSFNLEDLFYNFEVFPDRTKKRMSVVFLASKKESVQRHLSLFADTGFKVRTLEPVWLSLIHVFYHEKPKNSPEIYALIAIEKSGTVHIVITQNRMLLMVRENTILRPSGEGLPTPQLDFDAFITEVRLSLNYFEKTFPEDTLHKAVFFGHLDHEASKDWDQRFQSEFGIPVETGSPSPLWASGQKTSIGLLIAAGLALKEISWNKKLNLMPSALLPSIKKPPLSLPPEEEKALLKKWAMIEGALLAMILLGLHFFTGSLVGQKSIQLLGVQQAHTTSASVPDLSLSVDDLKLIEQDLNSRLSYLQSLIDQRISWTEKMNALAETTPSEIRLTSLDYTDQEQKTGQSTLFLTLEGTMDPTETINELELTNRFVDVLRENSPFMRGLGTLQISSVKKLTQEGKTTAQFVVRGESPPPPAD